LRRDYVNGCSSSPVGFLEGLYVHPTFRRRGFKRSKIGRDGWAAANLLRMSC
jgi:aminoglycoside 6'-N-acetyltransferase I